MPLELKKGSGYWYGRVQVHGQRKLISLRVRVQGKRPPSLSEPGDAAFEKSRTAAQIKLEEAEKDLRERGNEQAIVERLLFLKQGVSFQPVKLTDMFPRWVALSPGKRRSSRYLSQVKSLCDKFAEFAEKRVPAAVEMAQVSQVLAGDFMTRIEGTGVTAKTRNEQLKRLKTIFQDLSHKTGIVRNPFAHISKLKVETVHRRPLTVEEITAVLYAAKDDPFARRLIILALCTAMRRCDCCMLEMNRIDWDKRVISVKPAKGGDWVKIPIFGLLEQELSPLFETNGAPKKGFVSPEHAAMFATNPDGVTLRIKRVFERAGFAWTDDDKATADKAMSIKRAHGVRRASAIGIHSLRTSWITLALLAGVPVELVKRVTGQHSTDVILTYYFQPLQSQIRQALLDKLPPLLTGKTQDVVADAALGTNLQIRELLLSMSDSNWPRIRQQVLSLLTT